MAGRAGVGRRPYPSYRRRGRSFVTVAGEIKFTRVAGVPRRGVAHIRADKTLDSAWNANLTKHGDLAALAVGGGATEPRTISGASS